MDDLVFLKLGGSLITDKQQVETARPDQLARLGDEIAAARAANPHLRLVVGHGSGSFGHVAARRYGTRHGAQSAEQWRGMAEVSAAASRLNAIVCDALMAAGVPVISLPPHASAVCQDGELTALAVAPIQAALAAGLVPLVMGDVAFDTQRGATIVSTEEVFTFLAAELNPAWLLLAGDMPGVLDPAGHVLPLITRGNLPAVRAALGGSAGTDVTGGMESKVLGMLALLDRFPALQIRILSGLTPATIETALRNPAAASGTLLRAVA